MGKGQIVSGGENGQYQVKLIYAYRERVEQKITSMQQNITSYEGQITTLDAQIAAETDVKKKEALVLRRSIINLQITSLQKQIAYYQNNMPADPTVAAWCMDLTEDLSGYVGTAEIPGEATTVLIRPGYNGGATYGAARDGQLMPSIAGEPNQVLFNWMLLPGWQRHKPIYRIGTIVPDSIDFSANTCSVCLDAAYSSQQSLSVIDGAAVSDCNMGDDSQSEYLTNAGENFCSRNPGHPFCVQGEGSEFNLSDVMLSQLREVNQYVNLAYGRAADKSGITVGDRWDVMSVGDSGDCEDFALTKMERLVTNYGWSPDNLKLVTAYAKNGAYHAMLGVRTTNRGLVVLDVNYNEVMESGRVPYRLDKIALTSDTWKNYARKLEAVPIEYMNCNAAAFADGDRVIIEFTDQDWTKPKVIGFLESPESCVDNKFVLFGGFSIAIYAIISNTWTWNGNLGIFEDLVYSAGAAVSGSGYVFGGYDFFVSADALSIVYKINIVTESALEMTSMPSGKVRGCGGISGSMAYACGGSNLSFGGSYLNSNFEFDTATFTWATRQNMLTARWNVRGFSINSNPIYAGGLSGGFATKSAEEYNKNEDTFSYISQLPEARWSDAQTGNGEDGFCFGGIIHDDFLGDYNTPSAIKYNGNSQSWSSIQSMPNDDYWYYNEHKYPASLSLQFQKIYIKRTAKDRWNSFTGSKSRFLNSYDIASDSYDVLEAETRDEEDIASTAGQALGPSWVL